MQAGGWSGCVAVVLAGGASSRMGRDKLAEVVDGRSLLQRAVDGVPAGVDVVVVGPPRPLLRAGPGAVLAAREDPPGGGPAAGAAAGVAALAARGLLAGVSLVVLLAGDAPGAAAGVPALLDAVRGEPGAVAAVAVDPTGHRQPLLAVHRLTALARRLREAGAAGGAAGRSAGWLLGGGPVIEVALPADVVADVDTPADLDRLLQRRLQARRPHERS